MKEVREIPNHAGYYATDDGIILSLRRPFVSELRPHAGPTGYLRVALFDPATKESAHYSVHVLILETFVGPRAEGEQTRHLNGVKSDNRLANLAWGSVQENHDDKRVHGTVAKGSRQGSSLLTETLVKDIKLALALGKRIGELAEIYGVSRSTIDAIKAGRNWAHITV